MEKRGLSLGDLEAVDPITECEQSEVKLGEKQFHPVIYVATAIADFTHTQSWYLKPQDGYYHLVFFGLPGDVQIAVHLAKLIRHAMDMEWRFWWAVNCGLTSIRQNTARKNFMNGMAIRIEGRLYSMKQEREGRNNDCKAIVLRKKNIIEEALKAAGIKIYAGRFLTF